MTSYASVAASVAKEKAWHPERFCAARKCLWREVHRDGRVTPCPKHSTPPAAA